MSEPGGDEPALACPRCHHFARVRRHVIYGEYDGPLFYSCGACDHAWPRFTEDMDVPLRLAKTSQAHARAAGDWLREPSRPPRRRPGQL